MEREKKKTQLFSSINNPHSLVLVSTMSRWIKGVVSLPRIVVSFFKENSTYLSSPSRAKLFAERFQEILEKRRWSGKSRLQNSIVNV